MALLVAVEEEKYMVALDMASGLGRMNIMDVSLVGPRATKESPSAASVPIIMRTRT